MLEEAGLIPNAKGDVLQFNSNKLSTDRILEMIIELLNIDVVKLYFTNQTRTLSTGFGWLTEREG